MKYGLDQAAVDQVAQSVTAKMTVGGAVAGFFGWLAQINWIGLSAVLVAILGLVANVYFQHRRDKREQRESELRIAEIKRRAAENADPN